MRGNQAPAAPVLVGLDRDDTSSAALATRQRYRNAPGACVISGVCLMLTVIRRLGRTCLLAQQVKASIDVAELQALQADALEPGTSLSLQLRVIDAGEREAFQLCLN